MCSYEWKNKGKKPVMKLKAIFLEDLQILFGQKKITIYEFTHDDKKFFLHRIIDKIQYRQRKEKS